MSVLMRDGYPDPLADCSSRITPIKIRPLPHSSRKC